MMCRAHAPQMIAGEIAKGDERVIDFDRGKAGPATAAFDYSGGSVAPRGLGQVRVPVAAGASKRYEEGSSAERARVAKHSAGDRLRRAEHLAAGCGGDLVQPESAPVDRYWGRHRCGRSRLSPVIC
jgi:hypothetical protein